VLIIDTSVLRRSLFWQYFYVEGGDSIMKKVLAIVLSLMLLAVFAVGCKKADAPAPAPAPAAAPAAPADKPADAKPADAKPAEAPKK
jgi:hypothetical protein